MPFERVPREGDPFEGSLPGLKRGSDDFVHIMDEAMADVPPFPMPGAGLPYHYRKI